ncbi:DUF6249 domain-containing protein [[Eubacterium] cellulosolvens]
MAEIELALLIPILAIITVIVTISLDHQRKMKLIEKGLWKAEIDEEKSRSDDILHGGIIVTAVGIALLIGYQLTLETWVLVGLVLFFVGIAMILSYSITKRK